MKKDSLESHLPGRWDGMALKVMLVDDEPAILDSTSRLLASYGVTVVTTQCSDQILPLLHEEKPDVLLQDLRMPGVDLRSLLHQIRSNPLMDGLHVVLFTASLDAKAVAHAAGVSLLEKPFRPADLLLAVGATGER